MEIDLRDFPFMPLYVERLRRSKAWLACKREPALAFYMVNLWMRSWHEIPAGSLEDDDDVLADAAMCDAKTWEKVKARVLRGWEKVGDRLFHPTVTEVAAESWAGKQKQRNRTEAARTARSQGRTNGGTGIVTKSVTENATVPVTISVTENATVPVTISVTENATEDVTASKGQGQGQGQGEAPLPPRGSNGTPSPSARMPNLNSPWSAWEWLTDGEVEITGPSALRRPVAGGFYVDAVAQQIADAAGIDGHAEGIDWRPMVKWLRDGIPGDIIVETVKRVAAHSGYQPKTNLSYFAPAMRDVAKVRA